MSKYDKADRLAAMMEQHDKSESDLMEIKEKLKYVKMGKYVRFQRRSASESRTKSFFY